MKAIAMGLLLAAAAPAFAQAPHARCVHPGDLMDFHAEKGNKAVTATDAFRARYRIRLMETCEGLNFRSALRFSSFGPSCLGRGDYILTGGLRCRIASVDPIGPDAH